MIDLEELWLEYINKGLCSLCGNTGVVDTRGVRSPAGVACGRRNWCICPNGRASRAQVGFPSPKTRDLETLKEMLTRAGLPFEESVPYVPRGGPVLELARGASIIMLELVHDPGTKFYFRREGTIDSELVGLGGSP